MEAEPSLDFLGLSRKMELLSTSLSDLLDVIPIDFGLERALDVDVDASSDVFFDVNVLDVSACLCALVCLDDAP